jgi:U-box domain
MEQGADGLDAKLRRLADAIADGGEGCELAQTYDEVAKLVLEIRDLKFGEARNEEGGGNFRKKEGGSAKVPEHFLCPLSSELMRDPVVLSSGQVYEFLLFHFILVPAISCPILICGISKIEDFHAWSLFIEGHYVELSQFEFSFLSTPVDYMTEP